MPVPNMGTVFKIWRLCASILRQKEPMRKIIAVIVCLLYIASAEAQTTFSHPTPTADYGQMLANKTYTGTYIDTVTNSSTLYLYMMKGSNGSLTISPNYSVKASAEFKVTGTKITGAITSGSIKLQSSFNGTNWSPEVYYTTYEDTLALDSVSTTKSKTFKVYGIIAPYYRAAITTVGTQTSSYQAWYYIKREN